ncbi:MAG TPA: hypothetical protein VFZ66_17120 [Herpetosiphonaceae bacterium]
MTRTNTFFAALIGLFVALATVAARPVEEQQIQAATTGFLPLTEMGSSTYLGFSGGLYPNASNIMPSDHQSVGLDRARAIRPLDTQGNPSASGKYVMLSIGMSNTTQEFCSQSGALPCDWWTFMGQAAADSTVNKGHLVIANGAQGGKAAAYWDSPADPDYNRVRDNVLAPQSLSEKQVQIVWVKVANPGPTTSLPSSSADAYILEQQMGNIVRALKVRYPNVKQVFISSRIYAGYATTTLNPEPYAYESGFAVKWLIEAQIRQMRTGTIDPQAGDLNHTTVAPWVAWGAYTWADGTNARSDGLTWQQADFQSDGTHPSQSGERKVGRLLLNFFKASPVTRCWFVVGGTCP